MPILDNRKFFQQTGILVPSKYILRSTCFDHFLASCYFQRCIGWCLCPLMSWPGIRGDDETADDNQSFHRNCRPWRGGIILRSRAAASPGASFCVACYDHRLRQGPSDEIFPQSRPFHGGTHKAHRVPAPALDVAVVQYSCVPIDGFWLGVKIGSRT